MINVELDELELEAISNGLKLMEFKLKSISIISKDTIEYVEKLINKIEKLQKQHENSKREEKKKKDKDRELLKCPRCGSIEGYRVDLAGEYCSECGYDTITEY